MRGDAGKAGLPLLWTGPGGRGSTCARDDRYPPQGGARFGRRSCVAGMQLDAASHPGERASLGQGGRARLPVPGVAPHRPRLPIARGRNPECRGQGPCMRTGRYVAFASVLVALAAAAPVQAVLDPHVAGTQVALRAKGLYGGPIDGIAGPQTKRAVRTLQRREGILVDGVAGPQTRSRLGRLGRPLLGKRQIRRGMVGLDVSVVQFLLHRRGTPGRHRRDLRRCDPTSRSALPGGYRARRGRNRRPRDDAGPGRRARRSRGRRARSEPDEGACDARLLGTSLRRQP